MRELIGIDSGGGRGIGHDLSRRSGRGLNKMPNLQLSSEQPGYLVVPPDKLEKLVCNEPIEKYYEVEDQPFAR